MDNKNGLANVSNAVAVNMPDLANVRHAVRRYYQSYAK